MSFKKLLILSVFCPLFALAQNTNETIEKQALSEAQAMGLGDFDLHAVGDGLLAGVTVNDWPKGRVRLCVVRVHCGFWVLVLCLRFHKSSGAGVVDEVKAASVGQMTGDLLGDLVTAEVLQVADRLGFVVADVNHPSGNFLAFVVAVGLRAVEIDGAIKSGVGKICGGDAHKI